LKTLLLYLRYRKHVYLTGKGHFLPDVCENLALGRFQALGQGFANPGKKNVLIALEIKYTY
jgi:hypothetical protein